MKTHVQEKKTGSYDYEYPRRLSFPLKGGTSCGVLLSPSGIFKSFLFFHPSQFYRSPFSVQHPLRAARSTATFPPCKCFPPFGHSTPYEEAWSIRVPMTAADPPFSPSLIFRAVQACPPLFSKDASRNNPSQGRRPSYRNSLPAFTAEVFFFTPFPPPLPPPW